MMIDMAMLYPDRRYRVQARTFGGMTRRADGTEKIKWGRRYGFIGTYVGPTVDFRLLFEKADGGHLSVSRREIVEAVAL